MPIQGYVTKGVFNPDFYDDLVYKQDGSMLQIISSPRE